MAFDTTAFISEIAKQLSTNEKLDTEQRQALYDFYYQPTKLSIPQLMQLLQIEAQQAFVQKLILYFWETHRNVLINAAKNNKWVLKLQEALVIHSSDNSDSAKQIKEIAKQLKFSDYDMAKASAKWRGEEFKEEKVPNDFDQRPFHTYSKVELPIPETPETEREIPTAARISTINKEKKNSVFASIKNLVTGFVNTLFTPKAPTQLANVKTTNTKATPSRRKELIKNIVNAFSSLSLIKKLLESEKSSQEAKQMGFDSPTPTSPLGFSSPSTASKSLVAGFSSPSSVQASPKGFSSPSQNDENSSTAGFSSPSVTPSDAGFSSPNDLNSSPLDQDSPAAAPKTDSTKLILLQINNRSQNTSTLVITNPHQIEQVKKVAKKLNFSESTKPTSKPAYGKSSRVAELDDAELDDQENIDPNIWQKLPSTKSTAMAGFWSPPLSPTKCSQEAFREQIDPISSYSTGVVSP